MISSARSRSACGIVRPSALAIFILITSSNLVGCSIGKSPSLTLSKIFATRPGGPLPRLDFDNHFHFNWYVERQLGHADGRPSVFTDRLPEDLDHQVRTAIDDLGL